MTNPILYQFENHIATVTFNTPDNLNALDEEMGKAFQKVLNQIKKNSEVRVVILTGSGRAFSSGGNLDMIEGKTKKSATKNKSELKKFYRTFLEVRNLKVPIIAAINGHAVGAGFCLSLACDLRYAADNAKMGANFAKLGLAPGMGGTFLVTSLIGPALSGEVLLLAENLSAQRAYEMGLLNGVFSSEQLLHHVQGVARVIAENAPLPLQMIKKGIQMAQFKTLEQMFDYDSGCQAKTFMTEDIKEGIKAIREKRNPQFKGK